MNIDEIYQFDQYFNRVNSEIISPTYSWLKEVNTKKNIANYVLTILSSSALGLYIIFLFISIIKKKENILKKGYGVVHLIIIGLIINMIGLILRCNYKIPSSLFLSETFILSSYGFIGVGLFAEKRRKINRVLYNPVGSMTTWIRDTIVALYCVLFIILIHVLMYYEGGFTIENYNTYTRKSISISLIFFNSIILLFFMSSPHLFSEKLTRKFEKSSGYIIYIY